MKGHPVKLYKAVNWSVTEENTSKWFVCILYVCHLFASIHPFQVTFSYLNGMCKSWVNGVLIEQAFPFIIIISDCFHFPDFYLLCFIWRLWCLCIYFLLLLKSHNLISAYVRSLSMKKGNTFGRWIMNKHDVKF